jgi:hypothetical protein
MRTAVGVAQARELQLGRHGPAAKPRLGTRQSESRLSELSPAIFILSPNTPSVHWSWPSLYLLSQKLLPERAFVAGEINLPENEPSFICQWLSYVHSCLPLDTTHSALSFSHVFVLLTSVLPQMPSWTPTSRPNSCCHELRTRHQINLGHVNARVDPLASHMLCLLSWAFKTYP